MIHTLGRNRRCRIYAYPAADVEERPDGAQACPSGVIGDRPLLREPLQRLLNACLHLRYLHHADPAAIHEMAAAAKALRP